jgi:hypothetical protein
MTGRDLIIYILSNGLEDRPIYENGNLLGFITPEEAAEKFNVGVPTVYIWVDLDMLDGVRIGDDLYIPFNASIRTEGVKNNGQ